MNRGLLVFSERYQIADEPIGEGGMGVVYRAYDLVTKRNVAIKTMRGAIDPVGLELFAKEWGILARINHPNIVDIFDTGEFQEQGQRKPFFVMPFLSGRTFDYLIKNSSPRLTVERVVEIICQTCRGLQAAHENGLVHRDVKPSNIFVMEDDTVKIIDFGVAHLAGADTVTGIKGTLYYMSPEQLEMRAPSPASDIFSLGVVCYEALTGRTPFARRTDAETVEAIRHHITPPVCDLNPLASQLLSRVVQKALAKAPYHRFSSAREFADTLQKALNNQPIERFERSKLQPRIERAKKAQAEGDLQFASELMGELEAEGHFDPEMTVLRMQINQAIRQKSIRQLLASARTRREEDELPLALQKIQEVLDIDPENADALALRSDIEKERSERQIENWFRLAEQHAHHHAFDQARQAVEEVLKIQPGNARAREVMVDLDRREQEIRRIRAEKEQLYRAALTSYENGETSSALSKLERILEFSRTSPESGIPDRDAQYQGLYNQIRTERDAAKTSYAEGRRCVADGNFDRALEICGDFLKKHPGEPLFQALQLEAEEARRQQRSAFIAEVARRAEAEPDLDRRVNILKEACEKYPDEPHFQQSLRLIRDRRDLVNSILTRARQYEDRRQFGEALGQWDILRNIYAQYPGIDFEVERLTRRRDEQIRAEAKARWVEQIDRTLAAGDYGRARDLVRTASSEFPDDLELAELDHMCEEALNRAGEAEIWLERGQKLCRDGEHGNGLEALRKGSSLDPTSAVIRAALLNALIEHARLLVGQNWRAAELLIQEALAMDAANPFAKSMQMLALEYKRQELVNESLAEARRLQAAGDVAGAVSRVDQALGQFPNEMRLVQLRATLKTAHPAAETAKQSEAASPVCQVAKAEQDARAENVSGPEAAVAGEPFKHDAPAPRIDDDWQTIVQMPPVQVMPHIEPQPADRTEEPAPADAESNVVPPQPRLRIPRLSALQWGAFAFFPTVALIALLFSSVHPRAVSPRPVNVPAKARNYPVQIEADVSGAELTVAGRRITASPFLLSPGKHVVVAAAPGYRTVSRTFNLPAATSGLQVIKLHLEPEIIRLRVSTDLKNGQISFDGQASAALQEGGFVDEHVSLSQDHAVTLTDAGKQHLAVAFRGEAGKPVILSAPLKTADRYAVIVSSLGARAWIYSNNASLKAGLMGETPQPIPAAGLELDGVKADSQLIVMDGDNARPIPTQISNAPGLAIMLSSDADTASLRIDSKVPDCNVIVQGRKPRRMRGLSTTLLLDPGKYTIQVSKDGYATETQTVEIRSGATVTLPAFDLKPVVRLASLSIEGGTAGAEVSIDGRDAGTLGPDGSFSTDGLSPGVHVIGLKEQDFEERQISQSFSAGETLRIGGAEARLTPFGIISFKLFPETATASYRRDKEQQAHAVQNGSAIHVRAGRYMISASASGRNSRSEAVTVSPGVTVPVDWLLSTIAKPEPVVPIAARACDGEGWTARDGGWSYHEGKGIAWCGSGEGVFRFLIKRPESVRKFVVRKSGRIEWTIEMTNSSHIDYELEEKQIHRKVVTNGHEVLTQSAVDMGQGDTWNLELRIARRRIEVWSGGRRVDDFSRPEVAEPPERLGFKGGIALKMQ